MNIINRAMLSRGDKCMVKLETVAEFKDDHAKVRDTLERNDGAGNREAADIISHAVLDARGDSCPYPFIRTKWLMEKIASGEC